MCQLVFYPQYKNQGRKIINHKNIKAMRSSVLQFFGSSGRAKREGFTLIEILLVIGLIALLAAIVIVAVNPARQFANGRNSQRWSNINTILNAVHQYAIDNTGTLPASIPTSADCTGPATNEICKTGGVCTGLVDLSVLTNNEIYIVSMPTDPTGATTNGAGYHVAKSANGRVTVCAPDAELTATVSVTR